MKKQDYTDDDGVEYSYNSDGDEFINYKHASYSMNEPLDEIAVPGKSFVYCINNKTFTETGYISNIIIDGTYKDFLKVANELIETTKDYNHHFLECIELKKVINENGLQLVELYLGS